MRTYVHSPLQALLPRHRVPLFHQHAMTGKKREVQELTLEGLLGGKLASAPFSTLHEGQKEEIDDVKRLIFKGKW